MQAPARGLGVAVLTALLTCGCAGTGYYRLPLTPGADGSVSNDVTAAYFALGKPPLGARHAYQEFDPEADGEVIFVVHLRPPRQPFELRGVLHRPDGIEHTSFTRTGKPVTPGTFPDYVTHESVAMPALRPFVGRWTLRLTRDGERLGTYEFVLADRTRIQEFRRPR
jgi:hypothetical protein